MDMSLQNDPQWWALAFPHDHIRSNLKRIKEYELFHPRRLMLEYQRGKFKMVERSLYPGYAFIHCPASQLIPFIKGSLSGTAHAVRFGEQIIPINDDQFLRIKSLTDHTGLVGISHGALEGGKVKITSGPLKGHEGAITKLSPRKSRVTVQLKIGGRSIKLQLSCIINQGN